VSSTNISPVDTRSKNEIKSTPQKKPVSARIFLKMLEKLSSGNLHLTTPEDEVLKFGDHDGGHAVL
jgi:hypothetical protein